MEYLTWITTNWDIITLIVTNVIALLIKSPLPHITDYKDIKKEYSIQLMDDKNTYRTKPITGSADFLLDLLSEDKFDKKKVTVLVS